MKDLGFSICAPPNSVTAFVVAEQGKWFEAEYDFLPRLLEPGATVIDVGASYGLYTISLARAVGPKGIVHAYEPHAPTANMLRAALLLNGVENVRLSDSAVSDRLATLRFSSVGSSEYGRVSDAGGDVVPAVTLDSERVKHGWQDVALIKIDAEGHGVQVVRGAERLLTDLSPIVMFERDDGTDSEVPTEALESLGYAIYRLLPGAFLVPASGDATDLNLFALKGEAALDLMDKGLLTMSLTRWEAENVTDHYAVGLAALRDWDHTILPCRQRFGALSAAVAHLGTAAFADPTPEHQVAYGRALADMGRRVEAATAFGQAINGLVDDDARDDHLLADAIIGYERHRAWSATFSPQRTIPLLEWLERSPYATPEMSRRLAAQRLLPMPKAA